MLKQIRKHFKNFNALFISDPLNVYYLTGFTGSRGLILITKRKAYFFTDFRYLEYAKKIVPDDFEVVQIDKKWKEDWPKILKKFRVKDLGFEENYLTVNQYAGLKKISKGVRFKKAGNIVEQIREIKQGYEIARLRKSQRINEQVLDEALNFLKVGRTESEVEWFIIKAQRELGAEDSSFDPIVAFGSNSAIPHHQNTNRKLKKGHVVLLDMGVKYKHYCSDMTRTFFTAKPTTRQAEIYETVLASQQAAIDSLKHNITVASVVKSAMAPIKEKNLEEYFQHALGHGAGLNIHELPNLGITTPYKLKENMITTIEPGIYLPKNFGVRIEDMLIISRTGAQNITKAPKQLKDVIIKI
ncbi:M24 family metallopeptidase [Patescibacteria group bacterium]